MWREQGFAFAGIPVNRQVAALITVLTQAYHMYRQFFGGDGIKADDPFVHLPPVGHKGLAELDNMPAHGLYHLLFCGTGCEIDLAVQPVDLKEIPVCLPGGRTRAGVPNRPETVGSLDCPYREGDLRVFWNFFRYGLNQFYIPRQPVDKTAATRCIRIGADDGKTFRAPDVHSPNLNLGRFVLTITGVCARQVPDRDPNA